MKRTLLTLLLASAGTTFCAAQNPDAGAMDLLSPNGDHPRLVITKLLEPGMPRAALEAGVTDGMVRVVISVDPDGKLSDFLVIAYTHPAMGDAVAAVLKQWKFEPPTYHGQPVSVQREITFNFTNHGVVLSEDMQSFYATYLGTIFPGLDAHQPATMRDLDRIPTPLKTATPLVPKGTKGHVVVQFFIDETGTVRMPSIIQSDGQALSDAAVQAVSTWRFEPPTARGRPVLVRAEQVFHFNTPAQ